MNSGSGCNIPDLVRRIVDSCWPTDATPLLSYSPPSYFFRSNYVVHPIPFFGNLESAKVLTVGVNPSTTEFGPWRDWPEQRMNAQALSKRLSNYFKRPHPKPHPWFADIEEALRILNCSYQRNAAHLDLSPRATRSMRTFKSPPDKAEFLKMLRNDVVWLEEAVACCPNARLVIFVGNVLDCANPRGIGVGEFLAKPRPDFWTHTLKGRRWPKSPCPKSRLAERVFNCRADLMKHLGETNRNP